MIKLLEAIYREYRHARATFNPKANTLFLLVHPKVARELLEELYHEFPITRADADPTVFNMPIIETVAVDGFAVVMQTRNN